MGKSKVDNESRFIKLFEQRCADTYAQSCHEQIQQSSRCRLYKELKENHDIEPYLRRNISCTLRITFTTRCTRGDARSFFCTYKTYLYAQKGISYEYIQILFEKLY